MLKLFNYFRSAASYRVRIALHWKQLPFEYVPVHLINDGGQQNQADYRKINPMGHVPALDHNGFLVAESMAILQYLDDIFPQKKLFPSDPRDKAQVIQICEIINSGIQPLQNLKVLHRLENHHGLQKSDVDGWAKHWIEDGFQNLERLLARTAGSFCFGGEVTAADCFLIPQTFAAKRFGVNCDSYSNIARVLQSTTSLDAFQKAHPEKQPDYSK